MPPRHLKPGLSGFRPYQAGRQPRDGEGWVKLNTNEAPLEPSPRVTEALIQAARGPLRLYPDPLATPARRAVAQALGVAPEMVALGNGGDEILAMCVRAFAGAGQRVAYPTPSYPLLEPLCRMHEVIPSPHPLGEDWSLPASFAADRAPLKFLVNPNSPTGTWVDRRAVERVVNASRGVVALDEAYVDFAPESRLDLVKAGADNLLLVRSLSKSHALAGLRLGYAVGDPDLIEALDVVKDSYNVDRLAMVAAVAAVEDEAYHRHLVKTVLAERSWLAAQLRERGFEVASSAANFVFCRPPAGSHAAEVHARLEERRILVRHYDRPPIAGWLRVTVGTREQHQALLAALEAILA